MMLLPEIAVSLHIRVVIVWQNLMVMVFDDNGNQMPDCQGLLDIERFNRIRDVFNGIWKIGDWRRGLIADVDVCLILRLLSIIENEVYNG